MLMTNEYCVWKGKPSAPWQKITKKWSFFIKWHFGPVQCRELCAHFHSAASLTYHAPDTWHVTTPSLIILTLGRPVLALPGKSECQARSNYYHFYRLSYVAARDWTCDLFPKADTLPLELLGPVYLNSNCIQKMQKHWQSVYTLISRWSLIWVINDIWALTLFCLMHAYQSLSCTTHAQLWSIAKIHWEECPAEH